MPTIVAEALTPVPDALMTALRPGPAATGAEVARALARSLAPARDSAAAPAWLWPEQRGAFRRVVAALARYRGALLADPVGSGKTYIALAAARALAAESTACLVPASLVGQWSAVAERLGVNLAIGSHERASRGRLPECTRGLVIIDESHHFRNPSIRRYRQVATWLGGRSALLITSTPVVNRLVDVAHQLRLSVRDDALLAHGVPSLIGLLAEGRSHAALGHLIFARRAAGLSRPTLVEGAGSARIPRGDAALAVALDAVDSLVLSRQAPIAALIRNVFWRAAASSPAAFDGALRRYRRLLRDARDAAATGQAPGRAALRRFTAGFENQLVLWELLPAVDGDSDLHLPDLAALDPLITIAEQASQQPDQKVRRLRRVLGDGRTTLVFTGARETVRYLRDQLHDPHLAWCSGARAGIGYVTLPRPAVLGWFCPRTQRPAAPNAPSVLVTTDVAAEGLDLQGAARVIHYDLPWTPMRLEQREGRIIRMGSMHGAVEVIRFLPPELIEARLRQSAILATKSVLPATLGIGNDGRRLWAWRSDVAERFGLGSAVQGLATVASRVEGVVAGFVLRGVDPAGGASTRIDSVLVWLGSDGQWSDDIDLLQERLSTAERSETLNRARPEDVEAALARLAPFVRDRLRTATGRRWTAIDRTASSRLLVRRLQRLARAAIRDRNGRELELVERALRFAAGGHTAGEAELVGRLAQGSERDLRRALAALPEPAVRWTLVEAALIGLILFRSPPGLLRSRDAAPPNGSL